MKPTCLGISELALLLGILCPSGPLLAQQVKRVAPISKSVFVFQPIQPGGNRKNVVVTARGHKVKDDLGRERIDFWEIILLSVHNGQRRILAKTPVEGDDLFWFDARSTAIERVGIICWRSKPMEGSTIIRRSITSNHTIFTSVRCLGKWELSMGIRMVCQEAT